MSVTITKALLVGCLAVSLAACGGRTSGLGGGNNRSSGALAQPTVKLKDRRIFDRGAAEYVSEVGPNREGSIWELFGAPDENVNVRVNKYLWNASLETLSFLPVETVDSFTGVLVFGWGRAPGSSRQYRATVLVQDPALDARSLKVSVQTRSGPASAETVRRIEDAILTRARQLRVRGRGL